MEDYSGISGWRTALKIIGLDLAKVTGFAIGVDGELIASGTEDFTPKRTDSPGVRWIIARRKVGELLDEQKPDLVVWEEAFIGAMRSKFVAEWAFALRAIVQEECEKRGVAFREVHNTQIKLHATGLGNADKLAMQAAACRKWPQYRPEIDKGGDEADACWLLDYAMAGFPVLETQAAKKKRETAERRAQRAKVAA